MAEANIAVLIDFENVGLDNMQRLLDQLTDMGRVIIKRAYADWSVERNKRDQLLEMGIEAVHLFRSTKSGKNSADILLAIDAVDLLHRAQIDTFVIASSDSDFVPLVSKLRASGKTVIAAGRREAASPTLVRSCDRYIYLDAAKPPRSSRRAPAAREEPPAVSLVVRAMEASVDDQGQVVGSKLHQTMLRIDPSFNFRDMGYRTFGQYLESNDEVSISRATDTSDLIVHLRQPAENGVRSSDPSAPAPIGVRSSDPSAPTPVGVRSSDPGAPTPVGVRSSDPGAPAPDWEMRVDDAWTGRDRQRISGQAAATDAARVLGAQRLTDSKYPSLDKLLGASEYLRLRWFRDRNAIIRR